MQNANGQSSSACTNVSIRLAMHAMHRRRHEQHSCSIRTRHDGEDVHDARSPLRGMWVLCTHLEMRVDLVHRRHLLTRAGDEVSLALLDATHFALLGHDVPAGGRPSDATGSRHGALAEHADGKGRRVWCQSLVSLSRRPRAAYLYLSYMHAASSPLPLIHSRTHGPGQPAIRQNTVC